MKQNKFGEIIFGESEVCDLLMQGRSPESLNNLILEQDIAVGSWPDIIDPVPQWQTQQTRSCSVEEFHAMQQSNWHMPDCYKHLDIAQHVLDLCASDAELQRCGAELMLYQERGLFDLLKYLVYLVDTMRQNSVIWGVGRGSSVASYVLYKLGVHRVDSLYYNLDIHEFLR